MISAKTKTNKHFLAFQEFLKGTHPKSKSNIIFLPKDVLEIIWMHYVRQNFSISELFEFGFTSLIFEQLHSGSLDMDVDIEMIIRLCCEYGNLAILKKVFEKLEKTNDTRRWSDLIDLAAEKGHLHIIQWFFVEKSSICSKRGMAYAASEGHFEVVTWIHNNIPDLRTSAKAMDLTALQGRLHILIWLHENRIEGCTEWAMDGAARYGHLDVVTWLHFNRTEGCTEWAMDGAAEGGHLEIVKWLHENRTEGCTTDAMDYAAANGHLHVIEWLFENRTEGCTANAMNLAAKSGHLHVVIWLHAWSEKEGHITFDLDESIKLAAMNGHFHVVEWLRPHQRQKKYNIFCPPFCMFL